MRINKRINDMIEEKKKRYSNKSISWDIGYKKFGPFLFGLCIWLRKEMDSNKINNVYFLARDGFIIKKAFEIMYNDREKYHYLYLSRRSLALPSMINCSSVEEILEYLVLPPSFNIKELLKSLQLQDFETDIINKFSIGKDEILYRKSFKKDDRILKIIRNYKSEIESNVNKQSSLFLKYLKQENFINDVAIVDIGWHNSIQYLINAALKNEFHGSIKGYYVGVYNDSKVLPLNNSVYGYLYNGMIKKSDLMYKTFSFVSLLESLFLAQEGSTLLYEEIKENVVPILNTYEYEGKNEMYEIIKDIQDGALCFCEDFKDDESFKNNINRNELIGNLIEMGMNPTKDELMVLSKLEFENFTNSNIINYKYNSFFYLTHLKELKKDFYKSGWRIMFLKKLLPFPFPHYLFFKLLCKIFL